MNTPTVQIEINLVPYGYQIDIYDNSSATEDGNGVLHSMECRDFGGSYKLPDIAVNATASILVAMQRLESTYLKKNKAGNY